MKRYLSTLLSALEWACACLALVCITGTILRVLLPDSPSPMPWLIGALTFGCLLLTVAVSNSQPDPYDHA